ncbi:MarR family winged helix-turn-helix transcriptional regulator [Chloroflexota bacterium]
MQTKSAAERDFALFTLLYQVRDAMVKADERETVQCGISLIEAATLYVLKNAKVPPTPAEIARRLFREPNGVGTLLKRMEKRGLVTRTKDLEKKNLIRVVIMEEGAEVYRRVTELGVQSRLLSNLSHQELDYLNRILLKLSRKGFEELKRLETAYGLPIAMNPTSSLSHERIIILALLQLACDVMTRVADKELREYGVFFMQASVLIAVNSIKKPATPAEISRCLFREPHSISGLLKRMEKNGLVKRTKDLERKNLTRVMLTGKGDEIYRQVRIMKGLSEIFSCLSHEELNNIEICLWKLRDKAIKEIGVTYQLPFPEKRTSSHPKNVLI